MGILVVKLIKTPIIVCILILGIGSPLLGQEIAPEVTIEYPIEVPGVVEDFDAAWQEISDIFYDPEFGPDSWKNLKDEYRPKVSSAANAGEAYELMAEMIGTLANFNTFVVPPWLRPPETETQGEIELEYGGVGVLLQELQSGEVMVLNVFTETPAESAGVLVGDLVVGVNDWRVVGENPVASIADRVRGPVGTDVTLVLQDPDGLERDVGITRGRIDLRPSVTDDILDGTIGYLRIPMLSEELVQQASLALPRLLSTSGLILDLRSVSSGTVNGLVQIAQWFLGSAHMGGFISREGVQLLPFRSDAIAAYQRPIVVVTNMRTYGIGEILALILREYKRARIVGTQSEGGFDIGKFIDLPSGGLLRVSIARYATPQGIFLPAEGLVPDDAIEPPDLRTIRSGTDVYLEEAITVLRETPRVL